jgi:hypothetical protein
MTKAKGADQHSQKIVLAPLDGRIEEFDVAPLAPNPFPSCYQKSIFSLSRTTGAPIRKCYNLRDLLVKYRKRIKLAVKGVANGSD